MSIGYNPNKQKPALPYPIEIIEHRSDGFCAADAETPQRAAVRQNVLSMLRGAIAGAILCGGILPAGATDATSLVTSAARKHGVPVTFALRMAKIESGVRCHNHNRRSSASGPLQVTKGTAQAMGYRGHIRRASCATQTEYGMRALAMCWRAAKGRPALAKRCHQVGISVIYGTKRERRR